MPVGRTIPGLLALLPLLVSSAQSPATPPARFSFFKVFPGSLPEYTALTLSEDGSASYDGRALNESPQPDTFRLPPEVVNRIFALAAELNYFRDLELESPRKIANLGQKALRYEKGEQQGQVRFNYTENRSAAALQELCEKIARGRFYIAQLQFQLKFDRLAVLETLQQFENQLNNRGFVHLEQFVPVLTQVVADSRVVRLAQTRAQRLLERIRSTGARVRFEYVSEPQNWYAAINLGEDGQGSYESRRLKEPDNPQLLDVSPSVRALAFELLRKSDYLREPGVAVRHVAVGVSFKLAYEAGLEYREVVSSPPPPANLAALITFFNQILTQVELRSRLTHALGQDLVELPVVLHNLEQAVSRGALAEPGEFIPVLEQVARGPNFLEAERALARKILGKLGAATPR